METKMTNTDFYTVVNGLNIKKLDTNDFSEIICALSNSGLYTVAYTEDKGYFLEKVDKKELNNVTDDNMMAMFIKATPEINKQYCDFVTNFREVIEHVHN